MTALPPIRQVSTAAEVRRAAELIGASFDDLTANAMLVRDPARRQAIMTDWFEVLTAHAAAPDADNGQVLYFEDWSAVTVWFNRIGEPAEPEGYDKQVAELAGDHLPQFQRLDQLLEENHPETPHWHGAFFAVDPARQGQGRGTALITHTLDRLDSEGHPAYLEATNAHNRALYRRLGFVDLTPSEIPFDDATFYRMWRDSPR